MPNGDSAFSTQTSIGVTLFQERRVEAEIASVWLEFGSLSTSFTSFESSIVSRKRQL